MDPLVQGLAGSTMALAFLQHNEKPLKVASIGFAVGLLADLDVLIRSASDPLLFLEYHRHFTHSLFFIPIAAGIIAALAWYFLRKQFSFGRLYFLALVAYATHGLIDACTSYGTQLFWPFSNQRIAWNNVAIVDPIVTVILLMATMFAVIKKKARPARIGVYCMLFYLVFGVIQRDRAENYIRQVALGRGHSVQRLEAKPTVLNNFLFRTIYRFGNIYFVDAVRVGWFTKPKLYQGQQVESLNLDSAFPNLPSSSVQYNDIQRFSWFSDGYLVLHPQDHSVIGDLRFSMLPNSLDPLWGIKINSDNVDEHVKYLVFRQVSANRWEDFKQMLLGR